MIPTESQYVLLRLRYLFSSFTVLYHFNKAISSEYIPKLSFFFSFFELGTRSEAFYFSTLS